jgi:simple sugar transport system permease protein
LQILGIDIRTEFITMLPYLGVMLALVLLAGRTALPAALGIPYARGRR